MPFDGREAGPEIRRARLIEALRGEHTGWDFQDARRCAMPIAKRLYGPDWYDRLGLGPLQIARIFGCLATFVGYSKFYGCRTSRVTPGMVADALERAVVEGEGA